jgi:hypothetical protein
MSANLTTVLVAILAVLGTLSSPLLGQRIAARAKQQEFDLQRQERLETRADAQQREAFEERRAMYARLNTAARQYTQELRDYLRMLRDNVPMAGGQDRLEKARQAYRDLYSDAQMIFPDTVLKAST